MAYRSRPLFLGPKPILRLTSSILSKPLHRVDPDLHHRIKEDNGSQALVLNLLPSADYVWRSVQSVFGSHAIQVAASEGEPGKRYFPALQNIDRLELLCQQRALDTFGLSQDDWAVEVQGQSLHSATLSACSGVLNCHGRVLALNAPTGGFLKRYFTVASMDCPNSPEKLKIFEALCHSYQPELVLITASSVQRLPDLEHIQEAAGGSDDIVMAIDVSEIAGLVAAGMVPSPFKRADIVICGTQGPLRGPPGAVIFTRIGGRFQGKANSLSKAVQHSVFPGHHSAPHNHTIAAIATTLRLAQSVSFKDNHKLASENAEALSNELLGLGQAMAVLHFPPNHSMTIQLRKDIDIHVAQVLLNRSNIACTILKATKEIHFSTLAMTTRGMLPKDFRVIANILNRILAAAQAGSSSSSLCITGMDSATFEREVGIALEIRREVISLAREFPLP